MKKIVWMGVSLLAALIVVALIVPHFIPEKVVRKQVVRNLENALGRRVNIEGKIQLKFFPFVGAYVENASIAGNFKGTPLITLKSLDVNVATLPLLKNKILIDKLEMEEPVITLLVSASGEENWQASNPRPAGGLPPRARKEAEERVSLPLPENLLLSNIHITNGTLSYQNFSTHQNLKVEKLNLKLGLNGYDAPLRLSADALWNGKKLGLESELGNMRAWIGGEPVPFTVKIESELLAASANGKLKNKTYSGPISFSSPSALEAAAWLQGNAPDKSTVFAISVKAQSECAPQLCKITNAALELNGQKASGDIAVALGKTTPEIDMNLQTDQLDLTPFLPAAPVKHLAANWLVSDAYAMDSWNDAPMDFSALRNFSLNANVQAGGVKAKQISMGKTLLRARLQHGRLSADVVDADFYQGKANIEVIIDTAGEAPTLEKRVLMKNIQVEPFLRDALGEDRFSGTGNLNVAVSTRGGNERQMVSNLQGSGHLMLTDGSIKGINIADMVRNVQAAFKPVKNGAQKTDFAELGGNFTIAQGVLSNQDLAMKAPLLRLAGAGQINLPMQTIRYRLTPQIVDTMQGQGGKTKGGLGVPVLIEGPLDNPSYRPDLEGMVQDAITNPDKIKNTVDNVKDIIKDKKGAVKDVQQLLKGFR